VELNAAMPKEMAPKEVKVHVETKPRKADCLATLGCGYPTLALDNIVATYE